MTEPRVKLLTLHVGRTPLPSYVHTFAERMRDISIVDWEPLFYQSVEHVNQLVTDKLGAVCNKKDGYCLSDVRPMLAEVFPDNVRGYEWWGWVEMDTVLGDLDNLLPPLLNTFDAVSAFNTAVSGPLMMLRNVSRCNELFKKGNWEEILREPSYCNFEEVSGAHVAGFHKNGGFTKLLRESRLPIWWDDCYSLRWDKDPAYPTPAGCRLEGNRLIEIPTGRELMLYHFNHLKRWPIE